MGRKLYVRQRSQGVPKPGGDNSVFCITAIDSLEFFKLKLETFGLARVDTTARATNVDDLVDLISSRISRIYLGHVVEAPCPDREGAR